jgi:hypothetical protein
MIFDDRAICFPLFGASDISNFQSNMVGYEKLTTCPAVTYWKTSARLKRKLFHINVIFHGKGCVI